MMRIRPARTTINTLFITAILLFSIWLTFAWPTLKVTFDGSLYYKESDFREYYIMTPDLYKNMPRISKEYDFYFNNISGPAVLIWGVRFYDTDDAKPIEDYLTSQGWCLQPSCDVEADCWKKEGMSEVLSVIKPKWEKRVELQMEIGPWNKIFQTPTCP